LKILNAAYKNLSNILNAVKALDLVVMLFCLGKLNMSGNCMAVMAGRIIVKMALRDHDYVIPANHEEVPNLNLFLQDHTYAQRPVIQIQEQEEEEDQSQAEEQEQDQLQA
ncbi:Uncharacterized protein FWK35_00032664, partial [Aphis craccivora]